ncbi:winged helix-turn-helix domain-containing protein [Streptomyces sp. NPDC000658]|uniref:helix-turn-helix domain-containing protein n=1 Tax=Streptomyces sp. NPDC000658 TaxID=3154266 RepID=UPI00331D4932
MTPCRDRAALPSDRGLKSKGPAKLPKLSDERFDLLEKELAKGPAAHGWEDQRWTWERVRTLIGRQFQISCSIAGVRLLHRHGRSWQSPGRRALERDEHAVELWKKDVWPQVEGPRRRSGPGSSSRTRPGSR